MLELIVAVVTLVAIGVIGTLAGVSIAQNHAGDRARRLDRDRRLADARTRHLLVEPLTHP